MTHRTGGFFSPYSSEASNTARVARRGCCEGAGVKPRSCINLKATTNIASSTPTRSRKRHAERRCLGDHPAGHRAAEHRDPADHLAASEHHLQAAFVLGRVEGVDQPGLDRAREEGESQPEQRRDDGPLPEGRAGQPHHVVEKRRRRQGDRAEEIRRSPAPRVGDDSGRDLEDHHAGREEGVGGERLQVAEPGVEQEERVDSPDERGGQRVAEHQHEIRALNAAGQLIHRR